MDWSLFCLRSYRKKSPQGISYYTRPFSSRLYFFGIVKHNRSHFLFWTHLTTRLKMFCGPPKNKENHALVFKSFYVLNKNRIGNAKLSPDLHIFIQICFPYLDSPVLFVIFIMAEPKSLNFISCCRLLTSDM